MQRETGVADTHPSLSDRLQALEVDAELPPPCEQTAGEILLGELQEELTEEFSRDWFFEVAGQWRQIHERATAGKERLAQLESDYQEADLEDSELWELAALTDRFGDSDQALELFRQYRGQHPEDPDAQFVIGRLLLERGDESGLEMIEAAIEANPARTSDGCAVAVEFFYENDRRDEAKPWIERHYRFQRTMAEAKHERETLSTEDNFIDHALEQDQLAQVLQALDMYPTIKEAYLVRKALKHFPEQPLFIVGVVPDTGLFGSAVEEGNQLVNMIANEVEFPFETFIINLKGDNFRGLRKKFKKLPGAQIV